MFKLASNSCISPDSVGGVVAGESRFADINGEILDYPLASWCSWTTSIDKSSAVLQPLWSPPPPPPRFATCQLMYMYMYNIINYLDE